MNKLFVVGFVALLICGVGFVWETKQDIPISDLDKNFDRVSKEVDSYGGAMIVSYDVDTGEIIGKRRAYEPKEAGVLSVTENEYNKNKDAIPKGSLIIKDGSTAKDVVEFLAE